MVPVSILILIHPESGSRIQVGKIALDPGSRSATLPDLEYFVASISLREGKKPTKSEGDQ
jgi:hypothetical protein